MSSAAPWVTGRSSLPSATVLSAAALVVGGPVRRLRAPVGVRARRRRILLGVPAGALAATPGLVLVAAWDLFVSVCTSTEGGCTTAELALRGALGFFGVAAVEVVLVAAVIGWCRGWRVAARAGTLLGWTLGALAGLWVGAVSELAAFDRGAVLVLAAGMGSVAVWAAVASVRPAPCSSAPGASPDAPSLEAPGARRHRRGRTS